MLTLRTIQENPQEVIEKLAKKKFDAREIVNSIIGFTEAKNQTQMQADRAKAELNALSREIGQLMRQGDASGTQQARERTAELKESIRELDLVFADLDVKIRELLVLLPNTLMFQSRRAILPKITRWSAQEDHSLSWMRTPFPTGSLPAATTSLTLSWV